jgi:hypothetical protein
MDSTGRAVRRFERFLFMRSYQPTPPSEEAEVIATIVFRPDQQIVEVIRNEEVPHVLQHT